MKRFITDVRGKQSAKQWLECVIEVPYILVDQKAKPLSQK